MLFGITFEVTDQKTKIGFNGVLNYHRRIKIMAFFLLNVMISLYSTLTGITTMPTNYEANLQRHAADTWNRSNKEHLTSTGRYYMQLNLAVSGTEMLPCFKYQTGGWKNERMGQQGLVRVQSHSLVYLQSN